MRLPNAAHESRPWRIRHIAPDFTLEDVWALPARGGAEDFQTLLEVMTTPLEDPANWESLPAREGVHGAHQAVPVLGRLPGAHAADRTGVG
jgi:hypothetical protein